MSGWPPPPLMQDSHRGLFRWFAHKPDARRLVRENAERIMMSKMPPTVQAAFDNVRAHFPEVTHVIYTREGKWLYMDDEGGMPTFGDLDGIDTSLLEDAADEVSNTVGFPAVFHLTELPPPVIKHYAVPVVVLVKAENADAAYREVSDTLSVHSQCHEAHRMPCLLDESLNAFEYNPHTTEIATALDDPANLKIAKEFK